MMLNLGPNLVTWLGAAPGGPPPGPQQPQGGMFSPPQHPHQGPMGPMPPHMQHLMAFHPGMFMPRPPFMQGTTAAPTLHILFREVVLIRCLAYCST